jgi:hypothetical protein
MSALFYHCYITMKETTLKIPKVRSVETEYFPDELPEIINIDYDLWTLRITLSFVNVNKPVLYVSFKNVVGFRLLDESNLLEFWNPDVRVPGWIWRVENGGWFDLEKLREGFIEGSHENDNRQEYLITGVNECLSIIACSLPEFVNPE